MDDAEIKSLLYSGGTIVELVQSAAYGQEALTFYRHRNSMDVHITLTLPGSGAHSIRVRLPEVQEMVQIVAKEADL